MSFWSSRPRQAAPAAVPATPSLSQPPPSSNVPSSAAAPTVATARHVASVSAQLAKHSAPPAPRPQQQHQQQQTQHGRQPHSHFPPQQSPPPPQPAPARHAQYQLQQYVEQQQPQLEEYDEPQQNEDEYGTEYDEGYGDADGYEQQQQQPQWDGTADGRETDEQQYYPTEQTEEEQYGQRQHEGQYDEYAARGDDEQWMDEEQLASNDEQPQQQQQHDEHEQLMYEEQQQQQYGDGEHEGEQAVGGDGYDDEVSSDDAGSLHSLASHSHPLHPVQESEMEPTSPEMNASALPSDSTLSSTLASLLVDRSQQSVHHQTGSPPSAASSLHSPTTPQFMPLSPTSATKQRYIDCVDLLTLYCQQSTASDDTMQAALKLVDGLRYRYTAFTASLAGTSILTSASSSATELAAAMLRFMQSSLTPVHLQPLLQHAGRQVVEHLSLALSSVGCVALSAASSSHLSLASSLLQSRVDALRFAFHLRSYSQPLVYVAPHHAADIEALSFALSLPASSFFVVPTTPQPHSPSAVSSIYTMDAKHLHALLSRHKKEKRQSGILLLTVGSLCSVQSSSSGYQLDDVQQLTDIASQFGLWVHAEGSQIVESGQQHDYQQHDEEGADESASSARTAPDTRNWSQRYEEQLSSSAGVQTLVPSRVHSISLHANDYFTLPDTLAFTILTPKAGLDDAQLVHTIALTRAAASSASASVLSLWTQLLAVSSRSFSALLALFPALLTLSHAKLDAAKAALRSFDASLLLSPAEYAVLPAPPFLFFSLSLSPPFNHSYFHLTASQANELLADNLLRRSESDAELCGLLCSPSLTPSSTLFSHTGFLYSAFTPCPAAVDAVERHTSAFDHFLDCLQAELAVIAACGALMPTLQSLLSNEADFELVPPSALSASTRPGLCAFRFTPSSIPSSFHDELTKSLLTELTAALPAVFRGGQSEAAAATGAAGSSGAAAAVIVVELCDAVVERGVQSVVRAVHKLSKRVRLPSHVESELSAELKRTISATEAKLKAGQAGSGGVIRSIPIVGSFFSFFAGRASSKGHSYDINSSYTANTANAVAHAADKASNGKGDADKLSVVSGSGSGGSSVASSGKPTPLLNPKTTPPTPPTAALQPSVDGTSHSSSAVLPAAPDEQDGLFSRGTSAAVLDDSTGDRAMAAAEQAQPHQHQQAQYADEQPESDSLPAFDEQQLFDQLLSRNPADLLSYISDGTVLTIFFPSEPSQPDSPSAAIPLYLFYDASSASLCWCEPGARYVVAEQTLPIAAIAELHLGNADPAFPADAAESRCFSIVSELIQLHCEEEDAARRDEIVLALYSLLSYAQTEQQQQQEEQQQQAGSARMSEREHQQPQQTSANKEARAVRVAGRSDDVTPTGASGSAQPEQQQQHGKAPASKPSVSEEKTADVQPAQSKAAVTASRSHSSNTPTPTTSRHPTQSAVASSAVLPSAAQAPAPSAARRAVEPSPSSTSSSAGSSPSLSLSRALQLLELGCDFTVFLVDRSNPSLTSRHPVVLWWIPDSAAGKGRLCWSRRTATGPTRLEYHPSRSLLLSSAVELSLGKETKALCNQAMDDVDAGRCVSVMVDRTVLNLAADTEAARDEWLAALHTVMIHGNKKLTTLNDCGEGEYLNDGPAVEVTDTDSEGAVRTWTISSDIEQLGHVRRDRKLFTAWQRFTFPAKKKRKAAHVEQPIVTTSAPSKRRKGRAATDDDDDDDDMTDDDDDKENQPPEQRISAEAAYKQWDADFAVMQHIVDEANRRKHRVDRNCPAFDWQLTVLDSVVDCS